MKMKDRSQLSRVKPSEWRQRILRLPSRLRPAVFSIVWWDWIADPEGNGDNDYWWWPGNGCSLAEVPLKDLELALMACGYSRKRAKARLDSKMHMKISLQNEIF